MLKKSLNKCYPPLRKILLITYVENNRIVQVPKIKLKNKFANMLWAEIDLVQGCISMSVSKFVK